MVALHDWRKRFLPHRREQRQPANGNENRSDAKKNGDAGAAAHPVRLMAAILQQRVRHDEEREDAVPEQVQPRRALGPGAEQPCRREQAGEGKRVGDGDERREQIAAGQHQQRPRPEEAELAEQQDSRHQIVDDQRRFVDRDEGPDRRELHLRERNRRKKNHGGNRNDDQREPTRATARWQRRHEDRALVRQLARHATPFLLLKLPASCRVRAALVSRSRARGARSNSPAPRRSRAP